MAINFDAPGFCPDPGDMSQLLGPGHVDQTIRQAIQVCWMGLPKERRTVEEVERQIRRIVERALQNFRKEGEAFGTHADA